MLERAIFAKRKREKEEEEREKEGGCKGDRKRRLLNAIGMASASVF
jgi:hypothetical protein